MFEEQCRGWCVWTQQAQRGTGEVWPGNSQGSQDHMSDPVVE